METQEEGLRSEHGGLRSEHEGLRSEHEGLRSEHEGLRSEHGGLRSEHEGLRSEHEGLRSEHEGLRSEHEGLRSEAWGVMGDSGADSEITQCCTGHIQVMRHTIEMKKQRFRDSEETDRQYPLSERQLGGAMRKREPRVIFQRRVQEPCPFLSVSAHEDAGDIKFIQLYYSNIWQVIVLCFVF